MGAAGLTPVFASAAAQAGANEPDAPEKPQPSGLPQVPKRKLGKTGVEVPCLSLGGTINLLENQIMLKKALEWGVTYWDTSTSRKIPTCGRSCSLSPRHTEQRP
jgi:hypothetical protein